MFRIYTGIESAQNTVIPVQAHINKNISPYYLYKKNYFDDFELFFYFLAFALTRPLDYT